MWWKMAELIRKQKIICGKGFNPNKIKSKKTLGLLGMSERALIIKRALDLNSITGKGTRIIVRVSG